MVTGKHLEAGDVLVGLPSSGIHSNGLILARRVLLDERGFQLDTKLDELHGRTLGEELLEPTHIYVKEIMALKSAVNVKALVNIASDGLLNLTRLEKDVSYVIDHLPEPQPIFKLIQEQGGISDSEMYYVYNMGIGFSAIVSPADVETAQIVLREQGTDSRVIGHVTSDVGRTVTVEPMILLGKEGRRRCRG